MDAVEFMKESNKMCKAFNDNCKSKDGNNFYCGLRYEANKNEESCDEYIKNHPDKAVAIVEKWAKEHPRKTRQSEFLKQHPNASIERGVLELCPALVDQTIPCKPTELSCWECRKINWLAPIEESTNKEIN